MSFDRLLSPVKLFSAAILFCAAMADCGPAKAIDICLSNYISVYCTPSELSCRADSTLSSEGYGECKYGAVRYNVTCDRAPVAGQFCKFYGVHSDYTVADFGWPTPPKGVAQEADPKDPGLKTLIVTF